METQRVLAGVAANLEWTNVDQDGNATPAAGVVTADVERADGTVLLIDAATVDAGGGLYKVALTAVQNDLLDRLKATWTDAGDGSTHVSYHEVVGAYWFTVAQARAADSTFTETAYPTPVIEEASRQVEDVIEAQIAQSLGKGVSFVPRFRRAILSGNGLDVVDLPDYFVRTVRAISVAGTAFTEAELDDVVAASGQLTSGQRLWTRGTRNVVVDYEHGLAAPPPIIRRAALLLLKAWLPAFREETAAAGGGRLRSLSVEGLAMGFSDGAGEGTGVDTVDRLVETWLSSPDLASVSVA